VLLLLAAPAVQASGPAAKPTLAGLPEAPRANPLVPPPTRPCPPSASGCKDISATVTYTGFMAWAAGDVSRFWRQSFQSAGFRWEPARQVTLSGDEIAVSRCNGGLRVRSFAGPFYCASDPPYGAVYMPLGGIESLVFPDGNFRSEDFALTYVVAHEWGHHVQNLLGLSGPARSSASIELQADCLAGVWGYSTWAPGLLSRGDVLKAIRLANLVDDQTGTSRNTPHAPGTPTQRVDAFMAGYSTGRAVKCSNL
jgi:predicted metalloprotease